MNNYEQASMILNQALEAENGIKVKCATSAAAVALRYRLNSFRKKDREDRREVWKHDDPQFESPYDRLELIITKDDPITVHIRPRTPIQIIEIIKG